MGYLQTQGLDARYLTDGLIGLAQRTCQQVGFRQHQSPIIALGVMHLPRHA